MAKTELVVNGGFEAGLAPWLAYGGATVSTTFLAHEGETVAQLPNGATILQIIPSGLTSSQVYRLTVHLSSPGELDNSRTFVRLRFINSSGAVLRTDSITVEPNTQPNNANGTWNTHLLISSPSPTGTVGAIVEIATEPTTNTFEGILVDDVSLVQEN